MQAGLDQGCYASSYIDFPWARLLLLQRCLLCIVCVTLIKSGTHPSTAYILIVAIRCTLGSAFQHRVYCIMVEDFGSSALV